MYEEWFSYQAKKLNITEVIDGKNSVDVILPREISVKIDVIIPNLCNPLLNFL